MRSKQDPCSLPMIDTSARYRVCDSDICWIETGRCLATSRGWWSKIALGAVSAGPSAPALLQRYGPVVASVTRDLEEQSTSHAQRCLFHREPP